jgi:uncharacterized protein
MNDIPDLASLRAHMGPISPLAARKVVHRLDGHCRHFIALSPFLVIATADADGKLDASPRGDPPGFVRVIDDTTLLLPDRPGNNRVDSLGNVTANPQVGLVFFVPGIDETFRVNGRASVTTEAALLGPCEVGGRVPKTGLLIAVEEAFFHCAKALKRSRLWAADAQVERSTFPSLARVIGDQVAGVDVAEAEERIQASYRDKLY